ncbi:hypothetical protein EPN28_04570 [Patescibacteria group bacterium]|nr:MAG: hypothetical protein EPN28_04570 [Patescibacteria group bacterium]
MKVVHIIPSAFRYFDDIRGKAFELVEELSDLGVETEAFTIQYGDTTRAIKSEVSGKAPSRKFMGNADLARALAGLGVGDIVHVHCPLFGAAGPVLRLKKNKPQIPLLATFYRPARLPDFFSLLIKFYNGYYLPKIFGAADAIFSYAPAVHLTRWANKVQLIDIARPDSPRPIDFYSDFFNNPYARE